MSNKFYCTSLVLIFPTKKAPEIQELTFCFYCIWCSTPAGIRTRNLCLRMPALNPNEHIRDLDFVNLSTGTGIDEKSNKQLYEYRLERNYPNPFNPTTTIEFGIPKPCHVELSIYNLSGQIVDKLVSQSLMPGSYRYTWEAARFSSGVYFYKIEAGDFVDIKKMIFMK